MDTKKLEKMIRLQDGTRVLLRPVRAGDVDKLMEAFKALSSESRYFRFFKAPEGLSRESLLKALDVDFVCRVEMLAVVEGDGEEFVGQADMPVKKMVTWLRCPH